MLSPYSSAILSTPVRPHVALYSQVCPFFSETMSSKLSFQCQSSPDLLASLHLHNNKTYIEILKKIKKQKNWCSGRDGWKAGVCWNYHGEYQHMISESADFLYHSLRHLERVFQEMWAEAARLLMTLPWSLRTSFPLNWSSKSLGEPRFHGDELASISQWAG